MLPFCTSSCPPLWPMASAFSPLAFSPLITVVEEMMLRRNISRWPDVVEALPN